MITIPRPLLALLVLISLAASADAREAPIAVGLESYQPWLLDAEKKKDRRKIIDLFAKIPVQDDGRVKPLETVARFRLYHLCGKRSLSFRIETKEGYKDHKISAVEWYLDCLFRPEIAKKLPCLLVDNTEVLSDIGIDPPGARQGASAQRARINYESLESVLPESAEDGRGALMEKREEYVQIKVNDPEEFEKDKRKQQLLNLHDRVAVMRYLVHMLDFAHEGVPLPAIGKISPELGDPDAESTQVSEWLAKLDKIPGAAMATGRYDRTAAENLMRALGGELLRVGRIAGGDPDNPISGVPLFPPEELYQEDWRTIGEEIVKVVDSEKPYEEGVEHVRTFEELVAYAGDPNEFARVLEPFVKERIAEAKARDEYKRVPMELKYYKWGFLHRALPWFTIAFVLVALTWLAPGSAASRYLGWGAVGTCVLALLYVVGAIVMRCLIMGRPPISTLYETILFITAAVVLLCLIIEYFDRKLIAVAVAAVLGFAGMRLGLMYEMKEAMEGKGDTMVTLQAVLRSNFWLGTHVIIINLGYAAALLAAGLSMVYIVFRLTRGGAPEDETERSVTRMAYGIICFCLVFSLVGTVLGGVWANDSWGRFWGWDPKENGALMIVLWCLVILHARMGGYIRNIGLHANSVLLGIITVFSWWHVNELGVGLHAYGKTDGTVGVLMIVYAFMAGFMVLAGVVWLMEKAHRQAQLDAKARGPGKRVRA